MSNNIFPSIETLPVEILHRIFDNFDTQTILFSIRPLSRLFLSVVNSYNRYKFDFETISKSEFHLLCRLIHPQNVISLKIFNNEHTPDYISLFISLVRLRQFNRLHTINIFGIHEFQLNIILKGINLNSIKSFSLNIQKYDDRRKKTTINYLSSILSQSTLRNLELDIKNDRISDLRWPSNCQIEYLTVHDTIEFNDLHKSLLNCPRLRTLILKQSLWNIVSKCSLPQLTSLTIENLHLKNNELELLLSLTPSLKYLKLIGQGNEFDGKRWEQFIPINLPHLDKFEFFISITKYINQTHENLQLIIESFQNPFWMEYKKWFVACEFNKRTYLVQLYTLPICKTILQYDLDSDKIIVSNSTVSLDNYSTITNNINEINLFLKAATAAFANNQDLTKATPLFPNATKLNIDYGSRISIHPLKCLPSIVDLSQLVEFKIESFSFNKNNKDLLYNIISNINQAYNLLSLTIRSRFSQFELYPYLNDVCSILPRQIKRLKMPVNQLDHIVVILERCQNLSFVQFEITRIKFSTEVQQWFTENTINSTVDRRIGCDSIWIGKKINPGIKPNYKRIKLTDSQLES